MGSLLAIGVISAETTSEGCKDAANEINYICHTNVWKRSGWACQGSVMDAVVKEQYLDFGHALLASQPTSRLVVSRAPRCAP